MSDIGLIIGLVVFLASLLAWAYYPLTPRAKPSDISENEPIKVSE